MPDCSTLPYPAMFLDEDTTNRMDNYYKAHQGIVLKDVADKHFLKKDALSNMYNYFINLKLGNDQVNAVRIYFASYDVVGTPGLPAPSLAEKFTFIFAPAFFRRDPTGIPRKSTTTDYGTYYHILSGGAFDPTPLPIRLFNSWTGNWQKKYLSGNPPLLPADPHDDNNGTPPTTTPVVYSDTKCVYYALVRFKEVLDEIDCHTGAGGLQLGLTSYDDNVFEMKKRLTTQFKLADAAGNPIPVDKAYIQKRRPLDFTPSFDTGMPCPPYPGCNH